MIIAVLVMALVSIYLLDQLRKQKKEIRRMVADHADQITAQRGYMHDLAKNVDRYVENPFNSDAVSDLFISRADIKDYMGT